MTVTAPSNPLNSVWELRPFVSILLNSFRQAAVCNESILVNDIPKNIFVEVDRDMLARVLGDLLTGVISNTSHSCIQVTAKVYTDIILLHIKDHNNVRSIKLNVATQLMAEKIGGYVGVSSQRKSLTTIAFSFPNFPVAA